MGSPKARVPFFDGERLQLPTLEDEDIEKIDGLDRGERICNKADEKRSRLWHVLRKSWVVGRDYAEQRYRCIRITLRRCCPVDGGVRTCMALGGRSYVALGAPLYALNKNLMSPILRARKAATSCCRCSAVGSTREKTNRLENTEIVSSKVDFQVDRTRLKPQSAQCARIPALSEHLQRLDYFL